MLEKLFGNIVIEKILFYLLANEKGYATQLKNALDTPLYSIQLALTRLEQAGILVRRAEGKIQIYQFNPRYPFLDELKAFLQKAFHSIPENIRSKLYEVSIRKRPRRKGKPL